MALEEVRNELRRRIRRAATDLLGVAESPDCLGAPVTRSIPEVFARGSGAHVEQETSIPKAEQAPAMTESTAPEAAEPPAIEQSQRSAADRPPVGPPDTGRPPQHPEPAPVVVPDASAAGAGSEGAPVRAIDLIEPAEGPPGDDGVTVVDDESPSSAVAGADAFDRFMSDEIEDEPSRTWILT
jgi:hypothetical protein